MATMTAVKTGPVEGGKTQFRTQMVNGRPQIYFDALDESPIKPKTNRNNTTRLPEQPKPKPSSQKSLPQRPSNNNKPMKKANKVTFSDDRPPAGVFMTMDEIEELVKAAKESSHIPNHPTRESQEPRPPPPPAPVPQYSNEVYRVVEVSPPPLAPISPRQEALGMMAEKKRQKWMREKAEMDRMKLEVEYDQLKHQLSPIHQKASSSPERSGIPLDYSSMNKPPLPPSTKPNDNSQYDPLKTRLIEKKQQQWKQENAEKAPVWNPFGRPGAGAPNTNEMPSNNSQPSSNIVMPYRPPDPSSAPATIVLNDQTHVPAAMRTNLLFGDVRFEDDVKSAKEMERRQWLNDLQKQIEDNKRNKFKQQETERRHDFLQENVQPLVQEAANRHQTQIETSPAPLSNTLITSHTGQEVKKSTRHDSIVQQTYEKIVEATELAKYEKKAQLIEKLKRNGHKTDLLTRTLPEMKNISPVSTQKIHEKHYDTPVKPTTTTTTATRIEPLQLNVGNDARRDEAVNTIDSTFRSDNSAQTDFRMPPHKQMFAFNREESDLPPQIPDHLLRNSRANKKNVRIRSVEDQQRQRQVQSHQSSRDDGGASSHRSSQPPIDLLHRPLWNYHNPQHREYIPNSKRDPHHDKRQHSQEHSRRTDDIPKKTSYNRWNSDSALQQQQQKEKKSNVKQTNRRDETIGNLLKKQKPRQEAFVITKTDHDESRFNNISSLDKYEHFTPYIRTDEVLDPAKAFSPVPQSRETSGHRPRAGTITYDDHQRRQNTSVQPPPYHVPPARQEHILQQLSAIKENLVRRQQEVATSMNAIPV